jgi:hypothetical protein
MRLTKVQIGRSIVVLVALAACLGLAYIFAAPRHLPPWTLPLGRIFLAGLLIGIFLLFIRTDHQLRPLLSRSYWVFLLPLFPCFMLSLRFSPTGYSGGLR